MLQSLEGARARRTGFLATLLALTVSLVVLVTPSPASADVVQNVRNALSGWNLSANYGTNNVGDVYTVAPSSVQFHDWYIVDGNNEFINSGTGQCLSSNWGSGGVGDVYAVNCSGVQWHKWRRITGTISGYSKIVNVGTGWCLSTNYAGDVYTVACSSATGQNWRFL